MADLSDMSTSPEPLDTIDGRCPSTCGIGVEFHCERPPRHTPPHRAEGYGGLYVSWKVEWFTVAEEDRDTTVKKGR